MIQVHGYHERRAREFATQAHGRIDHRRKYTQDPYIVHPAAVADLVRSVQHDEAMLCAAWLHDTREDCGVTHEEILEQFGEDVAMLVDGLTDVSKPADGNRAVRKALDREHLARGCARVQTIKLADIIDNTTSIVAHDRGFARVYLREVSLLLELLTLGNSRLWGLARSRVDEAMWKLG